MQVPEQTHKIFLFEFGERANYFVLGILHNLLEIYPTLPTCMDIQISDTALHYEKPYIKDGIMLTV